MNTKLTLRMDESLVRKAKQQAARRGKSVSQMFGEYVASLGKKAPQGDLPPVTASLRGLLGGKKVSEADYKRHLRDKFM